MARPDLGLRTQINGASNGNLFGTGNMVSNARSIISSISNGRNSFTNGRWSTVNSPFFMTAMGLKDIYNSMAVPITNTMNAIISAATNGSSTANLTTIYQPIMDNYNSIWALLNSTDLNALIALYGSGMQGIYDSGIMGIVNALANMNGDFMNITDQIAIIRTLGSSSQNFIAPYYPLNNIANVNNGLKNINNIARVMINNITEIVKGLQASDSFISAYNMTIFKAQVSTNQTIAKYNSSIYSAVLQYNTSFTSAYNQIVGSFNSTLGKLKNVSYSSDPIFGSAVTTLLDNITSLFDGLKTDLPSIQTGLLIALANAELIEMGSLRNETDSLFALLTEMGQNITANMTLRVPNIDLCFNKYIKNTYSSLVNAIPRGVQSCTQSESNILSKTVMVPMAEITAIYNDALAIANGMQYCFQLGTPSSPTVVKVQVANCLVHVSIKV